MLRYLISILIGGILLLIFKDWLGINRKHPPRQKAARQPDSASNHEPETIAQSMPDGHEKAVHDQLGQLQHQSRTLAMLFHMKTALPALLGKLS